MTRPRFALAVALWTLVAAGPARAAADLPAQPAQSAPIVQSIAITGAHELAEEAVRDAARARVGEPLPDPVDRVSDLAARVAQRYRDEGFTFAKVAASFDEPAGALTLDIDEGQIDAVEFTGVDERLQRVFAEDFAIRAGDVFNRRRARQALEVLLRQTRGAVLPGRVAERGVAFYDSRQLGGRADDHRSPFDLVDRNGERVLLVGLDEPAGRFRLVPDLGDREDWFTPVDGFVPSLGFGAAVFDHRTFNHAYVAGHLSIKTASDRAGYAIGFERPFLSARKLYVGAEIHDLTVSDDRWQVSSLEASLAAIGPRRSFRDYYRRRGVQIGGAFRPHPRVELLANWRGERHEALPIETDFSFWNDDELFRPNRAAREGHLNALVVGASVDSAGFDYESLDATYRRHQLDTFFGQPLDIPRQNESAVWRLDWTTEISAPDAFGSDFDFRRHIVSARYRKPLSPHQDFGARFIRGWSGGSLPPQRTFALGGIGSVHGYPFKSAAGDAMTLVNLEYALGWRNAFQLVGFYDIGHVPAQPWMKGIGWGIGLGDFRIDFGYRTDDIPGSLQVLLRFGRTF